jgi:hypothetical protein
MRFFSYLIFIPIVLFLTACSGDNASSSQNNNGAIKTSAGTTRSETPTQPKRVIDLKPKNESPNNSPQPTPRQVSDTTGLFSLSPGQRIIVEDFKIGPLQDFLIGQYDRIKAALTVHDFMKGLSRKEIKQELIKPEMRTEIKRSLSYSLKNNLLPEEFRIGKIIPEAGGEINVNIRVFKGQSVTEGEIYLLKENGEWMIIDMQIGFTLLAEKYKKDTEPFSPSSYEWLLRDYLE